MDNVPKTILIIEDDVAQREVFKLVLQKAGYSVSARGDASSGLRWLEQIVPDLILMDYMLPQISGAEMLAEIRKRPNGRHVPVIVATAVADIQAEVFKPYAVHALLQKPLSPRELVAVIKAALL